MLIMGNILANRKKMSMLSSFFNQMEKAGCIIHPVYIYMTSDNKIFASFILFYGGGKLGPYPMVCHSDTQMVTYYFEIIRLILENNSTAVSWLCSNITLKIK